MIEECDMRMYGIVFIMHYVFYNISYDVILCRMCGDICGKMVAKNIKVLEHHQLCCDVGQLWLSFFRIKQ